MIGDTIRTARKKRGWTLDQLGDAVDLTKGTLSSYENDQTPSGPTTDTLCKIADALNDLTILVHHCQECPVRKHVFIKLFPDLNNINPEPAIIANKLRKEMLEGAAAMELLVERLGDADFKSRPDYMEIFEAGMEQVIDVKRAIEILEYQLILSGAHSSGDLKKIYNNQQAKCIANGHHKPEEQAA